MGPPEKKTPVHVEFLAGRATDRGGIARCTQGETPAPSLARHKGDAGARAGATNAARAASAARLPAAILGTTAKFQATSTRAGFLPIGLCKIDPTTGEISNCSIPVLETKKGVGARLERFALQSVVRDLLPSSRTAKCLRFRQAHAQTIGVYRSAAYGRAHYGGLQTCSSVWACPVCSAKISERRRAELQALIGCHELKHGKGTVLLVTRTAPHSRSDDLEELLSRMSSAEAGYKAHRDYKTLAKSIGLVGTVKAVEVTHGNANGFHPHVHELLFLAKPCDVVQLEESLSFIWTAAAVRSGFNPPSREHGLTVQDGTYAAKYASKWGLESELTQWHRKRGRVESRTPFDLLRAVLLHGDTLAASLFKAYAEAFQGRHQLQFSRGLKALYSIEEVTDEELTNRQDDDAVFLGNLDLAEWRLVCKTGNRGSLLEIAAAVGWSGVELLLDGLKKLLPESRPGGRSSL